MALQQDIKMRIEELPMNVKEPIQVLLTAITQQKQDQFTDKEIEQRLIQVLEKVIKEDN
ncbi:hypothetical protein [Bombilactobacillus bombi]|uniref:hypothetical protein n=1 Tax=Bombilactobacillus bombi TaxID=1303590 RepID=UPI0013C34459|nr:hypothetical protein [Bombilactobacillus bombi]